MNEFYMGIKDRLLLYFSKYKRARRMNPNPNFPNSINQLLTLLYLQFLHSHYNKHPINFNYCFLFSEYFT